jgi:hypothetical protein
VQSFNISRAQPFFNRGSKEKNGMREDFDFRFEMPDGRVYIIHLMLIRPMADILPDPTPQPRKSMPDEN